MLDIEGVLSSVAMKVIVKYPVWLVLGFQEKDPVEGSKVAPGGNWFVDRATVLPMLRVEAETVKLIHDPVVVVWFLGIASAGG